MYKVKQTIHAILWAKRHFLRQLAVDELKIIQKWLRPKDICLDVGAHGGSWSIGLSKLIPDGRVYAFEALPYYAQVLQSTVRILGKQNITIINQAVTSKDKRVNLVWTSPDGKPLTGMTHLAGSSEETDGQIPVEGVTLDTFLDRINAGQIRFVKIDVEGAELTVLQGASALIKKQRPIFFLEINYQFCIRYAYKPEDIFNLMYANNYNGYIIDSGEMLPTQSDNYSGNGDVLFMPKELLT